MGSAGSFKCVISILLTAFSLLGLDSCMKWDYGLEQEEFSNKGDGLFIICEGNFQYGNSTLSFYNPTRDIVTDEVFFLANGMKLGDVAQSMTEFGGLGWIAVNNSRVVFAIDMETFREVDRIEGFTSPRYILFINDEKAYVSQLWDNRIFIINPSKFEITGYLEVPGMQLGTGSTEQMVRWGKYAYCSCWSYQNRLIKIDTDKDEVVAQLEVGIQPKSLAVDACGKLWTITDGGFEGSPLGYEAPALFRIDSESFTIEKRFELTEGVNVGNVCTSDDGKKIYWINDGVWKMDIEDTRLPYGPFIKATKTRFFGLTVSPSNGDIYVADAIDYQQKGIVYRYDAEGTMLGSFYVGVNPGSFCWKTVKD